MRRRARARRVVGRELVRCMLEGVEGLSLGRGRWGKEGRGLWYLNML